MAIRQQRIAQIILKEVSEMLQFEIKDAEIGFVTVADVSVSGVTVLIVSSSCDVTTPVPNNVVMLIFLLIFLFIC